MSAQPSFVRRNRVPLLVVAALVVGGGAGAGITLAATGDPGSTTADAPSASGTSSVPGEGQLVTGSAGAPAGNGTTGKTGGATQRGTRATIVSESATSWSVRTAQGQSVTVSITPTTKFGTKQVPSTRSRFAVGRQIAVVGPRTGSTVTAQRIRFAQQPGKQAPAPSSTPSSSPS